MSFATSARPPAVGHQTGGDRQTCDGRPVARLCARHASGARLRDGGRQTDGGRPVFARPHGVSRRPVCGRLSFSVRLGGRPAARHDAVHRAARRAASRAFFGHPGRRLCAGSVPHLARDDAHVSGPDSRVADCLVPAVPGRGSSGRSLAPSGGADGTTCPSGRAPSQQQSACPPAASHRPSGTPAPPRSDARTRQTRTQPTRLGRSSQRPFCGLLQSPQRPVPASPVECPLADARQKSSGARFPSR